MNTTELWNEVFDLFKPLQYNVEMTLNDEDKVVEIDYDEEDAKVVSNIAQIITNRVKAQVMNKAPSYLYFNTSTPGLLTIFASD